MAKSTIDDLTTPMSREEVQASIYRVLAKLGVNTTAWKSGSVVRTMIAACSLVISALTQLAADITKSGFLALSSGPWLTLVAKYVYGVDRIEASYASGVVTLTNAAGGIYIMDPGDLVVANTAGHTFRNLEAFTLPAMSSLAVSILATESGAASTSNPGTITHLVTTLLGVTSTNDNAVIGTDDELDPALRLRCSERLGALSPMGPWDAYGYALRGAKRADGTNLGITRIRLVPDGFGRVFVYCATATGALPSPDLPVADEAVQRWAAPQAITAIVGSATEVAISVVAQVFMYNTSGLSPEEIEDALNTAMTDFVKKQPVGGNEGFVYQDALRAAIVSALPEIYHSVVTSPGDTALTPTQALVYSGGTWTITQIPPPQGYLSA